MAQAILKISPHNRAPQTPTKKREDLEFQDESLSDCKGQEFTVMILAGPDSTSMSTIVQST